ncbi:MAG: stage II sporulation protein M [Clostridia bacterium]|nr:stage II sporulation protein M [Clostridia bacterium]
MIFINNTSYNGITEITSFIENLRENIKTKANIDRISCLIESLNQNTKMVIIIWVLGSTIIGSFFIYFVVAYKGFLVGYTISAIIASLGIKGGSIFVFSYLLFPNIIFLPSIFVLAESGIKVYLRIIKNNVNIKTELVRHFIIMLIVLFFSCIASIIEAYFSTSLLLFLKNFI